jgi:hypothetical protein
MKRSYLFRFRATLALIAIFATILIFGPRIWHRHKVNQAVATVLASAPGDDWAFGPYSSANPNDLLLMMSNSDRVFARLYSIAADRAETLDRQRHALALMETLASQPNASTLRSE